MIHCQHSMVVQSATWLMRQQHVSSVYPFQKKMNSVYHWRSFVSPRQCLSLTISHTVSSSSHTCIWMRPIYRQNISGCLPSSKMCNNAFTIHLICQKNLPLDMIQPGCKSIQTAHLLNSSQ